mgnify:CR=1 FL=1
MMKIEKLLNEREEEAKVKQSKGKFRNNIMQVVHAVWHLRLEQSKDPYEIVFHDTKSHDEINSLKKQLV